MKVETLEQAEERTEKLFRWLGMSVRTRSMTAETRVRLTGSFLDSRIPESLKVEVNEWLTSPVKRKRRVDYFWAGEELPSNHSDNHQKEKQAPHGVKIHVRKELAKVRKKGQNTSFIRSSFKD